MDIRRVKTARPHVIRAFIATVVAVAADVWGSAFGQFRTVRIDGTKDAPTDSERLIALAAAGIVLIAGILAVRAFAKAARVAAGREFEEGRAAPLGFLISVIGYLFVVLAVLGVLDVSLGGLVFGGALTGVVIGIAAQQTLGNFFAGIVLLVVRPFTVGDDVFLKSAPLGGEYEGRVFEMSLFYVHLTTEQGPVMLPNAGVLAAAVGPGARGKPEADEEEAEETEPDPGIAHGGTAGG